MMWIVDGNGFDKSWDISDERGSIATVRRSGYVAELMAAAPVLMSSAKEILALQKEMKATSDPDDKRRVIDSYLRATKDLSRFITEFERDFSDANIQSARES